MRARLLRPLPCLLAVFAVPCAVVPANASAVRHGDHHRSRHARCAARHRHSAVTGACYARRGVLGYAAPGPGSDPATLGARPKPRFFAPSSFWNAPLPAGAPLDPSSARLVASLNGDVNREIQGKWGPWLSRTGFSTPIYTVPRDQPPVHVTLDNDDGALQAAFDKVPLPPDAQPADGSDGQLTVWQPSTDKLWEFWKLNRQTDGWHAKWGGAMRHVSSDPGYYDSRVWPGAHPWWGASGTSLPLVGGLITLQDLRRGRIDHALAIALPHISAGIWSWPAQRSDGAIDSPDAVPEGARFRLDPHLNVNSLGLPPLTRMLAHAAQTYGMVVRDNSGVVAFFGEDPTPTGTDPYAPWFGNQFTWQPLSLFPWARLHLLRMQLSARPGYHV